MGETDDRFSSLVASIAPSCEHESVGMKLLREHQLVFSTFRNVGIWQLQQ